ncbi:MAG: type II secretion system F family protein [Chloroflexi bacterium]|nr:type II secretion system F family protein [Chloroflexota bacterium]
MAIEYEAYDRTGKKVTGVLEIDSSDRAQEALIAADLVVLSLRKRGERKTVSELMPTFFGIKPIDIIAFTRELASLLDSGIPLYSALGVLYEETQKGVFKKAIRSVTRDIESGISLSRACAKIPSVFPPFYISLLQVAEETGKLKEALLEIVDYLERQRTILSKIRRALTYPTIVFIVSLVGAFIVVTFALPPIVKLLEEYQARLPLSTKILLWVSNAGVAYGKQVLITTVALAFLVWQYSRTSAGKVRLDRVKLKIPVIGGIVYRSQMARLCSSLTTLLGGGVPTADAIRITAESTENSVFREAMTAVYHQALTGDRLEPAIRKQAVFPRLFAQTVGIGEEGGSLKDNLRGLTAFYEQETERAANRATDMVEPTIIIFVGMLVGFIGVSIMSAIYGLIPQIK